MVNFSWWTDPAKPPANLKTTGHTPRCHICAMVLATMAGITAATRNCVVVHICPVRKCVGKGKTYKTTANTCRVVCGFSIYGMIVPKSLLVGKIVLLPPSNKVWFP